jgi:riboflavin kinase/FMN adenylyltransferase
MEILTSMEQLQGEFRPCVLAMGTFDGLHLGHLDVIHTAKEYALRHQLQTAVFTFSNHPYTFLCPEKTPVSIQENVDKEDMLNRTGVDLLVQVPFDAKLANLIPQDFFKALLPLNIKCIVVGENFTYGIDGNGNTATLQFEGKERGIEVIVRPLLTQHGSVISSTAIRTLITAGKLERAALMLGRAYSVAGIVKKGFQRGSTIGFPTANLYLDRKLTALPPAGVYAVDVKLASGKIYQGMGNLGMNPTFTDVRTEVLETNLFGFQGDLYGQRIEVIFKKFLREETKFASIEELKKHIAMDAELAKQVKISQ